VAILADGAPWIWNLAAEHFGERVEIVDFYHAAEHLWTVARALEGAETPAAAWAETRRHELRHQGAAPVLRALGQAAPTTPEATETVRLARGYFRTNADRMAYPTFRAAGLPIGSGAVESSARHLVQQRMKRAGMRWSNVGAAGMLALLAHRASGRPMPPSAFLSRPQPRQPAA
jgi:Arc/MetJ family transcription regulator